MKEAPGGTTCVCYAFCNGDFLGCEISSVTSSALPSGCEFNDLITGCTDADRPAAPAAEQSSAGIIPYSLIALAIITTMTTYAAVIV